jgi:hypothetical protein
MGKEWCGGWAVWLWHEREEGEAGLKQLAAARWSSGRYIEEVKQIKVAFKPAQGISYM